MEDQNPNVNSNQSGLGKPYHSNKKVYFIIGTIVILVVVVAFVLYFLMIQLAGQKGIETSLLQEELEEGNENTYGTLPENTSLVNPLKNAPEINPADKANPLKDTYKNPFE